LQRITFLFLFCFVGTGIWTQDLKFAKQH
jgi:hypothetical protein